MVPDSFQQLSYLTLIGSLVQNSSISLFSGTLLTMNRDELVEPEKEQDIRPQVVTLTTKTTEQCLGSDRFERFSEWRSLVRSMAMLVHVARSFSRERNTGDCKGWHW